MAVVEINCPHCGAKQKVATKRLKESCVCMHCNQVIDDVYLYKVAPPPPKLKTALRGRIVSEFGTTQLADLEAESEVYTRGDTGGFKKGDTRVIDRISMEVYDPHGHTRTQILETVSTATKTYVIAGLLLAGLAVGAWYVGSRLLKSGNEPPGGAGPSDPALRTSRYEQGQIEVEWRVKVDSSGQEVIHGPWVEYHEGGSERCRGQYHEGERTGQWKWLHPNGNTAREGEFKEDLEEGLWLEYHADGSKSVDGKYRKGKREGQWVHYYHNATISVKGNYVAGVKEGDWPEWHPNKQKKTAGRYSNGLKEGLWRGWHDNAQPAFRQGWINGFEAGESVAWYRSGQQEYKGAFKDRERVGDWTWWYPSGVKQRQSSFVNGEQVGLWTEWHPNRQVKQRGKYEDGVRVGPWTEHTDDGDKIREVAYEKGRQISESLMYRDLEIERRVTSSPSGRPIREYSILKSIEGEQILHGPFKRYRENGSLAEAGDYLLGARNGIWRKYDSDGRVIDDVLYKHGIEQG